MIEFKLPSLGAEMDEGTLIEWKVKPGDAGEEGRRRRGRRHEQVGDRRRDLGRRHDLRARLGARRDGAGRHGHRATARARGDAGARRGGEAAARGRGAVARPSPHRPRPAPPAAPRRRQPAAAGSAGAHLAGGTQARADLGVDIAAVAGHRSGRARSRSRTSRRRPRARPRRRIAAAEMRRAIGAAMARSKREIPHYYLATDIPLARASRWLAARNEGRPVTATRAAGGAAAEGGRAGAAQAPELNGFYRGRRVRPGTRHPPRRRDLHAPGRPRRAGASATPTRGASTS